MTMRQYKSEGSIQWNNENHVKHMSLLPLYSFTVFLIWKNNTSHLKEVKYASNTVQVSAVTLST